MAERSVSKHASIKEMKERAYEKLYTKLVKLRDELANGKGERVMTKRVISRNGRFEFAVSLKVARDTDG